MEVGPFSITGLTAEKVWDSLTGAKTGDNLMASAIVQVLDYILEHKSAEFAFNSVALLNNAASM